MKTDYLEKTFNTHHTQSTVIVNFQMALRVRLAGMRKVAHNLHYMPQTLVIDTQQL